MAEIAQGWRPKEGDTVKGKVTGLDSAWSDYTSSYYPILTIQPDDGPPVAVHCFHAALNNRIGSIRPEIGDTLEITYMGKKKSADGKRQVSQYAVESDKPQNASGFWDRWDRMTPRHARPAAPQPAQPAADVPVEPTGDEDIPF